MTRRRVPSLSRVALVCLGLVVLGSLTACSPILDGKTGITRDSAGHLVGMAKSCKGKYDVTKIYQDDDPNASTPDSVAKWSSGADGSLLTWGLEERSPEVWTTSEPLTSHALTTGHTYVMDAWGETGKWSADELRFTVEDLKDITADTVLVTKTDPQSGETHPALIPRDQFTTAACLSDAS